MKPLFMWAGGKSKMLKHYRKYLPTKINKYYEPFFGGGAMFIEVALNNPNAEMFINDINQDIMEIYHSIKTSPTKFIEVVSEYERIYLPLSKEERKKYYYNLRDIHAYEYQKYSKVEESALLYFLMKTGFNGIFQINKNTNNRFGTPCGLLNQTKPFIDYGNITEWSRLLQNTSITTRSWENIVIPDEDNTFIFLDPPYRGCFTSYGQKFDDSHQINLLNLAKNMRKSKVFLCNRDVGDGFYDDINPLNKLEIDVTYTAGRRKKVADGFEAKKAKEILLYN